MILRARRDKSEIKVKPFDAVETTREIIQKVQQDDG